MGGRGRRARKGPRQRTINEEFERRDILKIIKENEERRETASDVGGGNGGYISPQLMKKCACCGEFTLLADSEFETCPNCGWIDDPHQNRNPYSLNGRNPISLIEAREEYNRRLKR